MKTRGQGAWLIAAALSIGAANSLAAASTETAPTVAPPSQPMTLEQAYVSVPATDQTIQIALAEERKADLLTWSALSRMGPRVTAGAAYTKPEETLSGPGALPILAENNSESVTVAWPLLDPTIFAAYRSGRLSAQAARLAGGYTARAATFGVAERKDHLPEKLSGGEQQRVAIARALANSPELIPADEPTAALDTERGKSVMELFRKVARERGSAVVCVTHDHRMIEGFDRICHVTATAFKARPRRRARRRRTERCRRQQHWNRFHRPKHHGTVNPSVRERGRAGNAASSLRAWN